MVYQRVKTYRNQIERSFRRYHRKVGEVVDWYEFDPAGTTSHDIYDEGPERAWHPAKKVPMLSLTRVEEREAPPRPEGYYSVSTVHAVLGLRAAEDAGITNVYDADQHVFDRFTWHGKVWDVRVWAIEGRLKGEDVVIGIDGVEVKTEEFVNDPNFPLP